MAANLEALGFNVKDGFLGAHRAQCCPMLAFRPLCTCSTSSLEHLQSADCCTSAL